jgi:hypothetical protein
VTKLNKYTKGARQNLVVTSINIESKQMEFIKINKINLSLLVRDAIDQLVKENNK